MGNAHAVRVLYPASAGSACGVTINVFAALSPVIVPRIVGAHRPAEMCVFAARLNVTDPSDKPKLAVPPGSVILAGGPDDRLHFTPEGGPSKLCLGGGFPRLNASARWERLQPPRGDAPSTAIRFPPHSLRRSRNGGNCSTANPQAALPTRAELDFGECSGASLQTSFRSTR